MPVAELTDFERDAEHWGSYAKECVRIGHAGLAGIWAQAAASCARAFLDAIEEDSLRDRL